MKKQCGVYDMLDETLAAICNMEASEYVKKIELLSENRMEVVIFALFSEDEDKINRAIIILNQASSTLVLSS